MFKAEQNNKATLKHKSGLHKCLRDRNNNNNKKNAVKAANIRRALP